MDRVVIALPGFDRAWLMGPAPANGAVVFPEDTASGFLGISGIDSKNHLHGLREAV